MNTSRIDETILASAGQDWTKVAMVISRVTKAMGSDLPQGDEGCELVARRIEALIGDGHLASQGNIRNWRASEIRQADG